MDDNTYRIFERLIRKLHKRQKDIANLPSSVQGQYADGFLTAKQMANLACDGGGTSSNAVLVTATISQFWQYFESVGSHPHKKYRPIWEKIVMDHSSLLERQPAKKLPTSDNDFSPEVFCREAIRAIEDEYQAAKESLRKNPVVVCGYALIEAVTDRAGKTKYLYEASLYYELDDNPPIPEGVRIMIWWPGVRTYCEAKLLSWDLLNNKVLIATARELTPEERVRESQLQATVQELIRLMSDNINNISSDQGLLCWQILGNSCPNRINERVWLGSTNLDVSQRTAVETALANDFTIIWGPPGTGKTYSIAHLIANLVLSGKRVLATSIANVAVDNMALAFAQVLEHEHESLGPDLKEGRFIRHGYTKRDELLKYHYLFPILNRSRELRRLIADLRRQLSVVGKTDTYTRGQVVHELTEAESEHSSLTREYIRQAKVVFTTAAQVSADTTLTTTCAFDVVIIDEASMMPLPMFVVAASRASSQVIAAGDYRQLAPVAVSGSALSFEYMHKSIFEYLKIDSTAAHKAMVMINHQRRMTSRISSCISETFYDSKLEDSPEVESRVSNISGLDLAPMIFLDIGRSGHEHGRNASLSTASGSRYNSYSAEFVAQLSIKLAAANDRSMIAVITPYRQQSHIIRKIIDELNGRIHERIRVGTVHTFQGSEADVVLWDLVDTKDRGFGRLYKHNSGDRLANVAVSRAKSKIVLIGDLDVATDPKYVRDAYKLGQIVKRYCKAMTPLGSPPTDT